MLREIPGFGSGKAFKSMIAVIGYILIGFSVFSSVSCYKGVDTASTKTVQNSANEMSLKDSDVSTNPTAELEPRKVEDITIEQLMKDYFDNPTEADRKHKNKIYRINGKVSMIGSNAWTNSPFLIFSSEIKFKTSNINVSGWFTSNDRKILEPLEYGDGITIIGKCEGYNSGTNSIEISDCKILNLEKSK